MASALSQRLDRFAFGCLAVAIVWAPWPLGANRPWAVGLLAAIVWIGLLAALASRALAPDDDSARTRSTARWVPIAGLTGFTILQVAQLVPGLGADGGTLTVDPFHTREYLLTTAIHAGAWWLVMSTVRDSERVVRLLSVVVLAGVLQAIAAVVLYAGDGTYFLFHARFDHGGRATGTFPSPDNLAGYLELGLSAALGWMLSQFGDRAGQQVSDWRSRTVDALAFVMSGKMLLRLVMVVMVVALVMTHSRMGNGAFFIALALVSLIVAAVSTSLRKPALWLVLSMSVIDVFIIGQWVGLDRVVERLQDTAESSAAASGFVMAGDVPVRREESIQERLLVPRLSLRLVADRPLLGHGGGTYATAFPPFKDPGMPLWWDHAHDDYVQVACDMGLIGLALWLSIGIATLWRAVRLLGEGQSRQARGVAAGALMALVCMGIHSVVDFNLHIPGIAMTFTVLLAAVWALPRRRRSRREVDE